jgi:hypothetical protein
MTKQRGLLLSLALVVVFLALNRSAYQGYFQDDEISALQWTRWGPFTSYLKAIVTPVNRDSFRAVGFLYFHFLEPVFGLHFPGYVAVLHAIHLFNVWLLWLILRRMGFSVRAACVGCAFFALHMALLDAIWKPTYIFDVVCATFCLASILLWARGNWILSFVSFWLAYKSKELAVMLPAVLIAYEWWFGQGRWKQLLPIAAGSLLFSLQALVLAPDQASPDYTFHFTAAALAATAPFYAERMFFVPYLGFLLPLTEALTRNRRTLFGLLMMGLFFFPLLFLPGRVLSAYCYLPFTGLAIALAGVVDVANPWWIAAFFVLWLPLDLHALETQRNDTLRQDGEIREWMTTFARYAPTAPPGTTFVYRGLPEGFKPFGIEATVRYFINRWDITVPAYDSPEGAQFLRNGHTTLLLWDGVRHRLEIAGP